MKKFKLLIFVVLIFFSYLYFENKFNINESSFSVKNYNIQKNNSQLIDINSNIKKLKVFPINEKSDEYNSIVFKIKTNKKNVLEEKIIYKEFLKYGYYTIDLSKIKFNKNDKYYFEIISDKNNISDYSLSLYFENNRKLAFNLIFVFLAIIFSFIYYYFSKEEFDFKKSLYKVALPIFLLYIILIPITAGHDEEYHWVKINEISSGIFVPTVNNYKSGAYLPSGVDLDLNYYVGYNYDDYFDRFDNSYDSEKKFLSAGSIDVYSPLGYIPQTLGVFISKIFTNNVISAAYIGRLFNMLFCIFLLSCAIKITPVGKKFLFLFTFNPLAIECFTTLSCDGITISLCILFVSYLMHLKERKESITYKDIYILSILSSSIALCKIIYILIPFLIFLIPKDKFDIVSRKKAIIYVIVFPIILNVLWLLLASSVSGGASPYSIPKKNMMSFFRNPFDFCKYFIYSIETFGFKIISEFFSNKMLMGEVISNNTIVPILMFFTFGYIMKDKKEKNISLSNNNKIFISILLLLLLIATFLSVYIFYIPYNDLSIWIVQGRYFFPEILIIYILFQSILKKEDKKYTNDLIIFTIVVVNFMALMEIFINYI